MMSQADTLARLTDSAPPIAAAVEGLRKICAWCPDFDPTAPGNTHATHTICPACFARVQDQERRRR
jgi:hypothetical protein